MNMCFGTKNSDKYSEKPKCLINKTSTIETNIDRKIKFIQAKSSNEIMEEEMRNTSEKNVQNHQEEMKKLIEVSSGRNMKKMKNSGKNSSKSQEDEKKKFIGTSCETSEKFFNKIPHEAKKKCLEMERFVGDGLTLRIDTNERDIEVTGDGCKLTMTTNHGRIRMIGDGCRLQIDKNSGEIEYTGDGGRVSLGPDSTGRKVHYIGEGGRIDVADNPIRTSFRNSKSARDKTITSKKINRRNDNDDDAEKSTEILDNIFNERRSRRLYKTTCKTVRIVNEDKKIVSTGRKNNSLQIDKSFTVNS